MDRLTDPSTTEPGGADTTAIIADAAVEAAASETGAIETGAIETGAIETVGLTRRFGDFVAVDGLDLRIGDGEIYGLLGPNGAGKSTTVRMLCTLLAPSEGSATVAGHDVVGRPDQVRLRIGVALQEAALDPKQTGLELLRLQARLYGLDRADTDRRLTELTDLVELGDALQRPIGSYSGGMARRLDLAAALIHNPEVLFLDEPTTGLDPASRNRVWEEVSRLNRELGMTILLTTQYLEEADILAHRVGVIDGGRLVAEGAPADLKRRVGRDLIVVTLDGAGSGSDTAELGRKALDGVSGVESVDSHDQQLIVVTDNGAGTIGPVAIALDNAAVGVRDLSLRTPTLDDVFLEVTGNRMSNTDGPETAEEQESGA